METLLAAANVGSIAQFVIYGLSAMLSISIAFAIYALVLRVMSDDESDDEDDEEEKEER